MQCKVLIKRFRNRKYYSVTNAEYINLEAILDLPLGSYVITDHVTKLDITEESIFSGLTGRVKKSHRHAAVNKAILEALKEVN